MNANNSNLGEHIISIFCIAYTLCRDVEISVNYNVMVFLIIFAHSIEYKVLFIYFQGSSLQFGCH